MSNEPNINKFIELCFIEGNLTPKRRQNDANVTTQTRIDKTRIEKKYSADFEKFYSAYPLKKAKQAAYNSWLKQKPNLQSCLIAISSQIDEKLELRKTGKFCPEWKHPATWLNQGCWEDETNIQPEIRYESVE